MRRTYLKKAQELNPNITEYSSISYKENKVEIVNGENIVILDRLSYTEEPINRYLYLPCKGTKISSIIDSYLLLDSNLEIKKIFNIGNFFSDALSNLLGEVDYQYKYGTKLKKDVYFEKYDNIIFLQKGNDKFISNVSTIERYIFNSNMYFDKASFIVKNDDFISLVLANYTYDLYNIDNVLLMFNRILNLLNIDLTTIYTNTETKFLNYTLYHKEQVINNRNITYLYAEYYYMFFIEMYISLKNIYNKEIKLV